MAKTHNLTELLGRGKTHELLVCVWDPTSAGTQPRGKQVAKPSDIWYTPATGIWQTVLIVPVNDAHIASFRIVTDADNGTVTLKTETVNADGKEIAVVLQDGKKVLDNISSYTRIRKISLGKEGDDFTRLLLNNRFDTERITELIKDSDPTRLVNSASGWTDRGTGNMNDVHHYPEPIVPPAGENRAIVLGEFGGLGLPVEGHTWEQKK